ncbi:MAG: hypothetical protein LBV51_01325 [Acholeplasmatales bacterium]|jgi:DNA polymerase-3 subunit delta'|nr:hypothetical protein [Acholeplasmatales bacterium]
MSIQIDIFKNIIKNNKLVHLYLVCGVEGSQKEELVTQIAALILDPTNKNNKEIIEQINDNSNPNVFIINPSSSVIKKEQISVLQEEFSKTSFYDQPRIYIINDVDLLNAKSANMLLKFLEEPTNKSTFGFLLTQNKERVLPTIISRSQIINVPAPTSTQISDLLISKYNTPISTSKIVSIISKSVEQIKEIIVSEDFLSLVNYFETFITAFRNNKNYLVDIPPFFDFFSYSTNDSLKKNYSNFLDLILIFLLDVVKYKNNLVVYFDNYSDIIEQISTKIQINSVNELINLINLEKEYIIYNININLQVFNFLVKFMDMEIK